MPAPVAENLRRWWSWPDGALWRGALHMSRRMRRHRFTAFMSAASVGPNDRVLDVGVTGQAVGASNYLEQVYPWPGRLTACGLEGCPDVCRRRGICFVDADALSLPFEKDSFDVACCNAVIEHVGSRDNQRRAVEELLRVAGRVWVSTPDRAGPMETHTLIPLAHWLPQRWRDAIYRWAGRGYFADEDHLNLLDAGQLRRLFPPPLRRMVIIRRQRLLGLPLILTAQLDSRK